MSRASLKRLEAAAEQVRARFEQARATSAEDHLRWLLEQFLRADLGKCSTRQRQQWDAELRTRIASPEAFGRFAMTPTPDAELLGLQREIRRAFDAVTHQGVAWVAPVAPIQISRVSSPAPSQPATYHVRYSPANDRDAVLLGVLDLIRGPAGRQLFACSNPKCGYPFVRTRRQVYCSETCNQQVQGRKKRKSSNS